MALQPILFVKVKILPVLNDWVELVNIRRIRGSVGHRTRKVMVCRRLLRITCVGAISTPILVLDEIAPDGLRETN